MTALANLAKFTGKYDEWLKLRQRYNLKWTSGNESLQSFSRFFNPDLNLSDMIGKVKEMIRILPTPMGIVIKHAIMTGLRPSETVESVRLLTLSSKKEEKVYYNPDTQTLEHYRYPEIFIRRTKKAYISYITKEQLSGIATLGCKIPTYPAIRMACLHRHIRCDMRFCRKIHGSWLHQCGISSETIDFLQGRVNPSVFSKHYLTPDSSLRPRVLEAVSKLQKEIEK